MYIALLTRKKRITMVRIETTPITNDRDDPKTQWVLISRSLEELIKLINGDWVDCQSNWLRVVDDRNYSHFSSDTNQRHYPLSQHKQLRDTDRSTS